MTTGVPAPGNTGPICFNLLDANIIQLRTATGVSTQVLLNSNASVITLNTWQHVAVVQNGGAVIFYRDGIDIGGVASGQQFPGAGPHPVRIGIRATDLNRDFDGLIDEVRIYNRALSADEIATLAAG